MRALFDTNILIDYLKGHEQAFRELLRYSDLMTSRITLMEVLAGAHSLDEEQEARKLLGLFRIVEIGAEIAERAVILKRERRLRLPDAIVLASAHHCVCPLITRNTGDFSPDWPEVRVPYQLPQIKPFLPQRTWEATIRTWATDQSSTQDVFVHLTCPSNG